MPLWSWLFRRKQEERDLEDELRFHLESETQLRVDRGETPEAARQKARREFGNFTLVQEDSRSMWGWVSIERIGQDLRFAARTLRKNPGFSVVAVLVLALGIGATTAIFSVVDSVLLKPLRFAQPDKLVMVWERRLDSDHNNVVQTQNYLDWRARNRSFEAIAAMIGMPVNLAGSGDPIQVPGLRVSAGFFQILGVAPILGRGFRPEEDRLDASCVAVMSHGLWQRRFGRQDVIGQRIDLSGGPKPSPCEVVGVMPPGFSFPGLPADVYLALRIDPATAPGDGRNYRTVARLRAGVSMAQAQQEISAIAAGTAQERPRMNTGWSARVVPLLEQTVGDARTILLVLLGAVAFVLLIACANVANLMLMRASSRRREMTLRVALGAGRRRLLQQLIVESLLVSVAGGLLGFLMALWGVPTILRFLPSGFPLPRMQEIAVDTSVLAFSLLISIGCGLLFGIFPALQVNRVRMTGDLSQGGRGGSAANRGLRNLLVIAEVAVAVLLVVGAGLMLRSFLLLNQVSTGIRPERIITFRMLLATSLDDHFRENRAARVSQMLDRIRALPQVANAAATQFLPFSGSQAGSDYNRTDRPAPAPGTGTGGDVSVVSDDYFRTMGIPVLAGREFGPRDRMGAPPVAVINQAATRMLYPGENPIGHRLKVFWDGDAAVEIVGVVADTHHDGLEYPAQPCLFLAQAQSPTGFVSLVVRTRDDAASAVAAVPQQMQQVAPNQGIEKVESMENVIASSVARPRLEVTLMALFGGLALTLACVGIYAVISYSVQQRTRELGIRLALGAAPGSILGMILREGMLLAVAGIATGLLAALVLTRYLASLLYTVKTSDPAVYVTVALILGIAAIAGCCAPAFRATRVDPAITLREE